MSYAAIDPKKTGLLYFDVLNGYYNHGDEERTKQQAPVVANYIRLRALADAHGMAVYFAKADHRGDGADTALLYTDTNFALEPWKDPENEFFRPYTNLPQGDWRTEPFDKLGPKPGDYVIPKHRWNAFHQTSLELSLRTRGIDTILVCGGATEIGVASTAFGARDLDFHQIFVIDACTQNARHPELHDMFMRLIFPRMGRVRTTDEITAMVEAGVAAAR
jgi:ureidoacrylate peracid hydrolase